MAQFFLFTRHICVYCSYSKLLEQKEELEQKHLHVIQILESERQAKWHYVQQTEELVTQAKNLKAEVGTIWVNPESKFQLVIVLRSEACYTKLLSQKVKL